MEMTLQDKEYKALVAQSANYRTILRFLRAGGLDNYLKSNHLLPIDLDLSPEDTTGGNSINIFLKSIADECNRMDQKITALSQALVDNTILISQEKRKSVKRSLFDRLRGILFR